MDRKGYHILPPRATMPRAALFGLASLLALAGCVSPVALNELPAEGAASNVLPWVLTECEYLVGWSPADPAKLQARVPEGFTIPAARPMGLVETPLAYLGTEVFECREGSGLDATEPGMVYGSIWYSVNVPAELEEDGVSLYMMKEQILVPDDARRERLAAAGLSVHDGEIAWGVTHDRVAQARLDLEDFGTFYLDLLTGQPGEASTDVGQFIEYTPTPHGLAAWRASYAWDEGDYSTGRGTIQWPEGSWAADAVGGRLASAQFHRGTWSFNGTLTLAP